MNYLIKYLILYNYTPKYIFKNIKPKANGVISKLKSYI